MKLSHTFTVSSLGELDEVIHIIGREVERGFGADTGSAGIPIWFRGVTFSQYGLLPTCYRDKSFGYNSEKTYSEMTLQEEMFYQSFQSRANHLIGTNPQSKIEWNELFQHHFGQTRMLDWTESLQIALGFALEPFIHPDDEKKWEERCEKGTPAIWILNPIKLNESVYQFFCETTSSDIKKALDEFDNGSCTLGVIQNELRKPGSRKLYFGKSPSDQEERNINVDGIFSLDVLEMLYQMNMPRLKGMLKRFEFNPFFYLLVRFYSDMLPVTVGTDDKHGKILPPLAIVQAYHSERIRNQRGAFTVFPNYILDEFGELQKNADNDLRQMDVQALCEDCIYKIRIFQPESIARDMIYGGARFTQLYPDVDSYAKTLVMKHFRV